MKQTKIFFQIVCATKYPEVLQRSIFNRYGVVNCGCLDCNSGPLISFLHTTKSNELKGFDFEFSVSRDGNPEHFHGFKEKNIWRILTQATIIRKGGGFPKHSEIMIFSMHSSLLKPRKDNFNMRKSIAPRNS